MTRFFDSEEVRKSLNELDFLRERIFNDLLMLPFFDDNNKKKEHLETMKEFLEKQKLFVFRMSFSDDPEVLELKERMIESAKMLGMKDNETLQDFFIKMEQSIENLEKTLDI